MRVCTVVVVGLMLAACSYGTPVASEFDTGRLQGLDDSRVPGVCEQATALYRSQGSDLEKLKASLSLQWLQAWMDQHPDPTAQPLPDSQYGEGWAQGVVEGCGVTSSSSVEESTTIYRQPDRIGLRSITGSFTTGTTGGSQLSTS